MGLLQQSSMTLSEVAKKAELQISTASYHLDKLTSAKIASHNKETGRYYINIDHDLMTPILLALRDKKIVSQLSAELKKDAGDKSKLARLNPELTNVINSKNFESLLSDIIDILYSRGLIVQVKKHMILGGTKERKSGDYWTLSWQGCTFLNICSYCRKDFDPKGSNVVAQTISLHGMGVPFMVPLLHPECAFMPSGAYMNYFIDPIEAEYREDLCHYCGLPLSEKVLRDTIRKTDCVSIIHRLLTLNEVKALNTWKREKLNEEFERENAISFPDQTLKDDIIEQFEFDVTVTKTDYERLSKEGKPARAWHHDWSKGPARIRFYASSLPSFSFLNDGGRKDLDKLYDFIIEGAEKGNVAIDNIELRKKELYSEWRGLLDEEDARIDKLVSEVIGDPRSLLYTKLYTVVPGPYDVKTPYPESEIRGPEFTVSYGHWVRQRNHDFALAKFENGKKYHIPCYQEIQSDRSLEFNPSEYDKRPTPVSTGMKGGKSTHKSDIENRS